MYRYGTGRPFHNDPFTGKFIEFFSLYFQGGIHRRDLADLPGKCFKNLFDLIFYGQFTVIFPGYFTVKVTGIGGHAETENTVIDLPHIHDLR